jgi:hypothetical protein
MLGVLLGAPGGALAAASGVNPAAGKYAELDYRIVPEASGMSVAARRADRLWLVNDSGNPAELIALDVPTNTYHRLELSGAENRDWEDLATFTRDGEPWIAIGDIGDNFARRRHITILFLPEPGIGPEPGGQGVARVHSTLELRYPDGPRDAESLAVDSQTQTLYVLSKRDQRPHLYATQLPDLAEPGAHAAELAYLGEVTSIPQPSDEEVRAYRYGRSRAQPTGLATHPGSTLLALLTYRGAYLARLDEKRDWLVALNQRLCPVATPRLEQGETIAMDAQGQIYVGSEGRRAPVYRLEPRCLAGP